MHMLNDLKARLEPLGVSLEFTEEAVRTIAKAGFDQYMAPVRCGGKFKLRWRIL